MAERQDGMADRITLAAVSTAPPGQKSAVGPARTLFRLVLGTIALSREAVARGQAQSQPQAIEVGAPGQLPRMGETSADRARYAAIGAGARAVRAVGAAFSTAGEAADGAVRLGARLMSPVTGSRLMAPAQRRFARSEARGEQILQSWIAWGRSEEALSRSLAQQTGTAAIEEVLDYLAVSPEMDELVADQTQDMAGEVVDEIRERTTKIFVFRDWFVAAILRRPREPGSEISEKNQPAS